MKYLKTFEARSDYDEKLIDFADHLTKIIEEYSKFDMKYSNMKTFIKILILYDFSEYVNKMVLFSIHKIDTHYGDTDMYFDIKLTNRSLPPEIKEISEFIINIISKYNHNMISFSNIPKMIREINLEDFEIWKNTKKYNI